MKTLFLFLVSMSSAFATEFRLSPGSSTTIRAGDEATITCAGGGGHGGGHTRCECKVGHKKDDPLLYQGCSDDTFVYVLKIDGAPVDANGCWGDATGAGNYCRKKLQSFPECK